MISLKNITLTYELYHDKTSSLKEMVVNLFHQRRYTEKKSTIFHALDDVSLEVGEGERVGIIGGNGAGKSTLLKLMSGILKPSKGQLVVKGSIQPLIEISAGFNHEFSGKENIYLNGYMLGFTKDQVQAHEQEIIDFAELGDFINLPVKYYSSGMSVRLAFAIATSIEPEILLFDEMLSAGDAYFTAKAQARMNSLLNKSRGMVIVSHDLPLIQRMCSRVIWLKKGKIIADGEPSAIIQEYKSSN